MTKVYRYVNPDRGEERGMRKGLVKDQVGRSGVYEPGRTGWNLRTKARKKGWGAGGIRKGFKYSKGEAVMKCQSLWFVGSGMTWKTGMKGVGMEKTEV